MNSNRCPIKLTPFPTALLISLAAALFLAAGAAAQAPTPAPAAPAVAAAPAPALENARILLAKSSAKEAALRADLLAIDDQIDAKVDEAVAMLKNVKDSTDSKTEVANIKKQAIEGLEKWIQTYVQERGRRLGQIQGPSSAAQREDLRKEVAGIDAEIDARIDQIVELASSMAVREETERYDTYVADFGVYKVESEDYRANSRQASRANQTQKQISADLEKAIAGIEREIALVPQRLPRDRQQAELDRLQKLLDERRADLRALATASPSEGREVSDDEASRLNKELQFAREDIRDLWARFQAQAGLLNVERQRRRQLEARVRYLEQEAGLPAPAATPAPLE